MKRSLVLTIVVLLISTLTVTSVLAARDPLIGAWESTDLDGSYQILTIGGGPGNTYHVRYYDFGASVCGLDEAGDFLYAASATGFLTGSGGTLEGKLPVYCMEHPPKFYDNYDFTIVYVDGTITSPDGVVWNRR